MNIVCVCLTTVKMGNPKIMAEKNRNCNKGKNDPNQVIFAHCSVLMVNKQSERFKHRSLVYGLSTMIYSLP